MTTRKELQAWLDQFPEDATIECITAHSSTNGYDSYTSASPDDLDLTHPVDPEFNTYAATFEIDRRPNGKVVIQLGVSE